MVTESLPVLPNQYYTGIFPKKFIFLHHTSGASAASAVSWWNTKPDRVSTPFIIERDGTIFQTFDEKYWAYALGVKGATAMEKSSIHIELVSWGGLNYNDSERKFLTYTKHEIPDNEVVLLPFSWRGYKAFHCYTDPQIESLRQLIVELRKEFNIPHNTENREKFWEFRQFQKVPPGIWSHTTVREDKSDIFPQPSLIQMVQTL